MADVEFGRRWIKAWNSVDVDTIVDLYAHDVLFRSPLVVERMGRPDGTLHGREELHEYVSQALAGVNEVGFQHVATLDGADTVTVIYWRKGRDGVLVAETMRFRDDEIVESLACYGTMPEVVRVIDA